MARLSPTAAKEPLALRLDRMKLIVEALEHTAAEHGPSFHRSEQLEMLAVLKREIEAAQTSLKPDQDTGTVLSFPRAAPAPSPENQAG
jgi:hypothetical protein